MVDARSQSATVAALIILVSAGLGRANGLHVATLSGEATLSESGSVAECGSGDHAPPCASVSSASASDGSFIDNHDRATSISLGAAAQLQMLQPVPENKESDNEASKVDSAPSLKSTEKAFTDAKLILKKPVGDHRQYQHTTLPNGLEVINVNDRSTKTAAFAVAVTAGLYYDPPEHYGLAHLTEHSLFLGTQKYPSTSGFDEYLAKNGGSSNAYTAEEVTVYYGNLNTPGFSEGLDRFADFFRAPLLNETSIWTEVNAVVSEHSKNVQNPAWYSERVMLSVANPASPLEHFHTGDAKTLQNLGQSNLSKELQSYFKLNYCPPRFKLVTFGSDSLYTQLLHANTTFGAIPKAGMGGACAGSKKLFQTPDPFPDQHLGKWLLVEGTTWSATLWMLFPLADLAPWTKSHPMNYVEYMIGYGGKNSLNLVLRDQLGLADSVGLSADDSSAGSMVWLTASLTPRGADKPEAVMDVIFTFLAHAKKGCTPKAISSLAKSARLVWDWPNPMDAAKAASTLAEGMTRLTPDDLLSADDLMEEPNQTRVAQVMERLRPDRMNAGIVRPDAEKVWQHDKSHVQTLPHYGVKYNVSTLDNYFSSGWHSWGAANASDDANMTQAYAELAKRLRAQNVSFDGHIAMVLPPVIEGIPENMTLCNAATEMGDDTISNLWGESPKNIGNSSTELWFRKGWVSPQPWVEASMTLRAHKREVGNYSSAQSVVQLQVGMHLLADELNQRLADVGYKGFYFSVSQTHLGVYVWLSGFTPNLLNLTDRMLGEMDTALDTPDNVSLARVLAGLKTDFTDYSGEAVKTAFTDQRVLLTPRMHSKSELADAISNGTEITWADTKKAVEDVRHGPFYATSLVMGNYAPEDAQALHQRLVDGIGAKTGVTVDQIEKVTPVVMPAGPVEIRKTNPREGDQNHVTIVTILVGTADVQNRVLLGLVGGIYSQVVFAELRTSMELGYVVGGSVSEMSTVMTIDCYVQGSKKLPDDVEADCERVMAVSVPDEVKNLDDATFSAHKDSFKSSLLEGPLTTNQELMHFEDPILLGGCLDLRSSMLAFLETVSKEQLLEAWNNAISPKNGTDMAVRKKVVVKYFNDGMAVPKTPTPAETTAIYHKAGLNGSALERATAERNLTRVVNEANSTVRESLAADGGYFPAELKCSWKPPDDEAKKEENDFKVLTQDKKASTTQPPASLATVSAHGMKFVRSEKPISKHHAGGDTTAAVETEAHSTGSHVEAAAQRISPSHRHVARRPHLHPQPSMPVPSLDTFRGRSAKEQDHLPGLPGRGGRSSRPPWARKLLDFESSILPSAPPSHFH